MGKDEAEREDEGDRLALPWKGWELRIPSGTGF